MESSRRYAVGLYLSVVALAYLLVLIVLNIDLITLDHALAQWFAFVWLLILPVILTRSAGKAYLLYFALAIPATILVLTTTGWGELNFTGFFIFILLYPVLLLNLFIVNKILTLEGKHMRSLMLSAGLAVILLSIGIGILCVRQYENFRPYAEEWERTCGGTHRLTAGQVEDICGIKLSGNPATIRQEMGDCLPAYGAGGTNVWYDINFDAHDFVFTDVPEGSRKYGGMYCWRQEPSFFGSPLS